MRRTSIVAAIVIVGLLPVALAQPERDEDALRDWMLQNSQQYQQDYAAGDLDAIVGRMAEEAELRGVDGTVYEGRDAYKAVLQRYIDMGARLDVTGPTRYGLIIDNVAWASYAWDFVGADEQVIVSGEAFYAYRATDDGWELVQQFSAPLLPAQ